MARKKKQVAEFRYYQMPENRVLFALLGEKWRQQYGRDIDYLHFHNYLEIGYCYEGSGYMTLGEKEISYHGGMFTVIPKNYLHTTNSMPGKLSSWEYLFVDVEKLLEKMVVGTPGCAEQMARRINSRAIFAESSKYPHLADLIKAIMNIIRSGEMYCQQEAEGLMLAFLTEVARRNGENSETYSQNARTGMKLKSDNLFLRIIDYISEHYGEALKISDIAKWAHISETQFRRMFSSYMNMSPLEYINVVRIQAACEYLKKTDEPVAMIAAKCGFTVSSTFNRNFRHITGVSPAEWRKRPENYEQQILRFQIHSEEGW